MSATQIPAEERQINLLLALRHSEQGMTKAEILKQVNGYDAAGGARVNRMFERDKDLLRKMGIPIYSVPAGSASSGIEVRYRVDEDDYQLPDIMFTPTEAHALQIAAQAWHNRSLSVPARRALTKLKSVTESDQDRSLATQESDRRPSLPPIILDLGEQNLPSVLLEAISRQQKVSFTYRTSSTGSISQRMVEPHRVQFLNQAWYLFGFDATVQALRQFRLERVIGDITLSGEAGAFTPPTVDQNNADEALLAIHTGRALALRAQGSDVSSQYPPDHAGRQLYALQFRQLHSFAGEIAAYGDAVEVLAPTQLRELVIEHLQGVTNLAGGRNFYGKS